MVADGRPCPELFQKAGRRRLLRRADGTSLPTSPARWRFTGGHVIRIAGLRRCKPERHWNFLTRRTNPRETDVFVPGHLFRLRHCRRRVARRVVHNAAPLATNGASAFLRAVGRIGLGDGRVRRHHRDRPGLYACLPFFRDRRAAHMGRSPEPSPYLLPGRDPASRAWPRPGNGVDQARSTPRADRDWNGACVVGAAGVRHRAASGYGLV